MTKGALRVPGVSSAMPRPAAETDRSGGTQQDHPLLRSLLSAPPLKPMDAEQELMRQIVSALAHEQGTEKPAGNKALPSSKPADSKARGQRRQPIHSRAGHEDTDSDHSCPSPDTTVRGPPICLPSGANYIARTPVNARLSNRGQQSVHYNYFNNAPRFIQPVQNVGCSEQNTFPWTQSQQVVALQSSHTLPAPSQVPPLQLQPTVLFHRKYGFVEYNCMQPQRVNPPAPFPAVSCEYPDVPVTMTEGFCARNTFDTTPPSSSSRGSVPHPITVDFRPPARSDYEDISPGSDASSSESRAQGSDESMN